MCGSPMSSYSPLIILPFYVALDPHLGLLYQTLTWAAWEPKAHLANSILAYFSQHSTKTYKYNSEHKNQHKLNLQVTVNSDQRKKSNFESMLEVPHNSHRSTKKGNILEGERKDHIYPGPRVFSDSERGTLIGYWKGTSRLPEYHGETLQIPIIRSV